MRQKPILFSAPMVRALLAGAKTQTRRTVKPPAKYRWLDIDAGTMVNDGGHKKHVSDLPMPYDGPEECLLWVREAWRAPIAYELAAPRDIPIGTPIVYISDGAGSLPHFNSGKYRQPMFMPRWASRITLRITGVRVERLQDISEADAQAEGVEPSAVAAFAQTAGIDRPAGFAYRDLWTAINGPGSWDTNPWVWVVKFERQESGAV